MVSSSTTISVSCASKKSRSPKPQKKITVKVKTQQVSFSSLSISLCIFKLFHCWSDNILFLFFIFPKIVFCKFLPLTLSFFFHKLYQIFLVFFLLLFEKFPRKKKNSHLCFFSYTNFFLKISLRKGYKLKRKWKCTLYLNRVEKRMFTRLVMVHIWIN